MKRRKNGTPYDIAQFSEEGMPMWTPNSIIRHKHTGIELLVVHVYRNCTIVVSLSETEPLVTPRALLERDYHYFARDTDMKNTDEVNYEGSWKYSPVKM